MRGEIGTLPTLRRWLGMAGLQRYVIYPPRLHFLEIHGLPAG